MLRLVYRMVVMDDRKIENVAQISRQQKDHASQGAEISIKEKS